MTSDLEWTDIKTEINNQIKNPVSKDKSSFSSSSLDNSCKDSIPSTENEFIDVNRNTESDQCNGQEMNQYEKVSYSVSDSDSLISGSLNENDDVSVTTYCLEMVEETEALQTENITEAIDIRISPRNSTVELKNFHCADVFQSEFSSMADVEVKEDEMLDTEKVYETHNLLLSESDTNNQGINECVVTKNTENNICVQQSTRNGCLLEEDIRRPLNSSKAISVNLENSCEPKYFTKKNDIKNVGNTCSFSVESKIAQEIKEMKQREEDLRKMREMLAKEMSEKCTKTTVASAKHKTSPKSLSPGPLCVERETLPSKNAETSNISQNYNIACVFAPKKKDNFKRTDITPKKQRTPSAISNQESPVEREIRIAKEREEELKLEREQAIRIKMQMESLNFNPDLNGDDQDSVFSTATSASICSDLSFDYGRKLVSPDLKGSNGILSPDSIIAKSNTISYNSSNAGSICSLDSISHSEKNSSLNEFPNTSPQSSASKDSLLSCTSTRSSSPDSSSNSLSKINFPFNTHLQASNISKKSVNMERFISSKGKEIVFKNSSSKHSVDCSPYLEIKPPQVKKGEQLSQKRFITAASKIQTELKEMKQREEELKKERERLMALNKQTSDNTEEDMHVNQSESFCLDNYDNANQSENGNDDSAGEKTEVLAANQTRRRSTLIDEWEQRIQKSGVQV
ncbi:uncharacterized protein LOC118197868 isoform X2 [Stegodyphus dumicola]|nr:uncharacterized protein LOC118197868 isoform X2 [Stegodyphus dumicola]XP_035225319.1 uncharacterized protein LOC118197868 isoform X2 [Stegodyphus dumicola]